MTTPAPYGAWPSPITAALAAASGVRTSLVRLDGDDVYWLEGRPAEGGRNVVVRRAGDGRVEDVTPAPLNVRTRVHEYGGGAYTVAGGTLYFSNDADQRLWRFAPGRAAEPLTPAAAIRYADAVVDARRGRLVCVIEDHRAGGEPVAAIAEVPLAGGAPRVLVSGADFYAAPRLSPDGAQLAFLRWSHPHMPWEASELVVAAADGANPVRVAGGPGESVAQPLWSPGGALCFVSDRSGWWNLYRLRDGAVEPLCPMPAEWTSPLWVFGVATYGFVAQDTIVAAYQQHGTWHLAVLDARTGRLDHVDAPLTEAAWLQTAPGRAVFVGGSSRAPTAIWSLHAGAGAPRLERVHGPPALPVDEAALVAPEAIDFGAAHGLFYPPHGLAHAAPPGERPPLIVISHGGPTAAASTALNLELQFWTSRGFAVLDVNYRGSTGYGRAFRQALEGAWGVADVEDCVAGARHLAAAGRVDGQRLLIRGSSAGGYTTLAALTFQDAFRAGASYYGVSDLESLARDTHKFESRYLDSLIGPYPARRDLYLARSPLHHADRLSRPVIFFQGLEDKVVPPAQAERMVEALHAKGVPVEYVTFPDEQHGFRRAPNVVRALEAELSFYRRVLGLPHD